MGKAISGQRYCRECGARVVVRDNGHVKHIEATKPDRPRMEVISDEMNRAIHIVDNATGRFITMGRVDFELGSKSIREL